MNKFIIMEVTFIPVLTGNTWADNNEIYRDKIHAPLADRIEVLDYEEPPDALSDTSEEYALVHDALPDGKIQKVHSTLKREFKPGKSIISLFLVF